MSKENRGVTMRPKTALVRGGVMRSAFQETSEALFLNSGYVYDTAEAAEQAFNGEKPRYVYSRYANPTVTMFEERLRLLEGAEVCRGTSSGMAAVHAAMACFLRTGDRIVASRALFGSCSWILTELLPRWGVETLLIDGTQQAAWEEALATPTQAVFLETPSNPGLELVDLEMVSNLAHAVGAHVIVDNIFATPVFQKPLAWGADVVVYSTTKHIDGQGRCLGGAVLCTQDFDDSFLREFLRHTGPSLSPFNAWTALKGLETLDLRVQRMGQNALELAHHLEGLGNVERVIYPGLDSHPQHALATRQMTGFGTVVTFDVKGGKEGAFRLLNRLQVIDISNNLGDAKTLATHPASTTHYRLSIEERARVNIMPGTLRLSVGLEDIDDLKEDLARALDYL